MKKLNVVIIKPSKYGLDGFVDRFWRGFMPNASLSFFQSMIPGFIGDTKIFVSTIDEYVQTKLDYLNLLNTVNGQTLLLLVGVQSHQFHRALDLATYARKNGCLVVIGGPHAMTCDTSMLQGHPGISFSLAEAESVLQEILVDASKGGLKPVYGANQRWVTGILNTPVLIPPTEEDLGRSIIPMAGLYPSRGCPKICKFCSVIKIAGRRIRSQAIQTTVASFRALKAAGVKLVMVTSDNFNKIPNVTELLNALIEEDVCIPFFCQCDAQVWSQPDLLKLMARAKCFDVFVGVETFNPQTLHDQDKTQNRPEKYIEIVNLCREVGINTHFSNIIGFPNDTEESILEDLATLKKVDPDQASFYVLCPIPGTVQYDEFMERGWIIEKNLDRFDTISSVWQNPNGGLSFDDRTRLLFRCYKEFYTMPQALRKIVRYAKRRGREGNLINESIMTLAYTIFSRFNAATEKHPMSGGVWQIRLDHVSDYKRLRGSTFGYDLIPLPKSLKLSEADEQFFKNKTAV